MQIDLKSSPFSVLKALAISIAKEIDAGDFSNADLLEEVFVRMRDAK